MRKSLNQKVNLKQGVKFQFLSLVLISLVCATLNPLPNANAAANPLEVLSVTKVSDTSVEILFKSKISKSKIKHYIITAAFDPLATNIPESTNFNSSNLIGSSVKKVLKVKSTGLISTKLNNLSSKAPYIFTVSAQMNQGKLITSESINYFPLSNLMDTVANLPADWGNPKPIQLPTPAPTSTPLASPAFTLSSSSETRTVNTAATGFTVSSTGGAIASFAINATPPGMSFNTSTGALTGTPNTVAGATAYTITATNASGSATRTFTLTVAIVAPAFTISSASETKASGSAITGYTISSTGGAIASYAISPAAPAGLSFSTSTGLLSGTPTTVAGATAYTITATNASGSATQTFTLTVTTVVYSVGQAGPGGGIIYFVSNEGFTCGPTLGATCNYLEVAPSGWNTGADPDIRWTESGRWRDISSIANDAVPYNNVLGIGVGYRNSIAIVNDGNDITTAAGKARAYTGGGKSDWYLPSLAELNLLCQWVRGIPTSVTTLCSGGNNKQSGTGNLVAAGIKNNYYWSSSEKNATYAWYQDLYYYAAGEQDTFFAKSYNGSVRPVRAF